MNLINPARTKGSFFMKIVSAFALLIAGLVATAVPAIAQNANHPNPAAKKTHAKKAHAATKKAQSDEGDPEPDITGQQSTNFDCELGNKLTVYQRPNDEQHIALRWHKHVHELTRVQTTTGANRFENTKQGLVWIGIPAKSMLLDSRKGQQLANECKSPEQEAMKKVADQH
jgi:hypothetical protein